MWSGASVTGAHKKPFEAIQFISRFTAKTIFQTIFICHRKFSHNFCSQPFTRPPLLPPLKQFRLPISTLLFTLIKIKFVLHVLVCVCLLCMWVHSHTSVPRRMSKIRKSRTQKTRRNKINPNHFHFISVLCVLWFRSFDSSVFFLSSDPFGSFRLSRLANSNRKRCDDGEPIQWKWLLVETRGNRKNVRARRDDDDDDDDTDYTMTLAEWEQRTKSSQFIHKYTSSTHTHTHAYRSIFLHDKAAMAQMKKIDSKWMRKKKSSGRPERRGGGVIEETRWEENK